MLQPRWLFIRHALLHGSGAVVLFTVLRLSYFHSVFSAHSTFKERAVINFDEVSDTLASVVPDEEHRCRIYTYEIPQLNKLQTVLRNSQFASESMVHYHFLNSFSRTRNPADACFFLCSALSDGSSI